MNILFVVSNLSYPPTEGAHDQTFNLIKNLLNEGYSVKLEGFIKSDSSFDVLKLKADFPCLKHGGFEKYSTNYIFLAIQNFFFRRKVNYELFDIIHFEGFGVLTLVSIYKNEHSKLLMSLIDPWARRQKRRMLASKDIIHKFIFFISWKASYWLESLFLKDFDAVHLVSDDDLSNISLDYPKATFISIPVFFEEKNYGEYRKSSGVFRILFWGDLAVPYLSEGLLFILKSLLPFIDNVELKVLGRMSKSEYLKNKNVDDIEFKNIEFMTWVDDLDVFISDFDVVILPDRNGTGLKNRTIYSMMLGMAVVGSDFAFDGVAGKNKKDFFICNSQSEYLDALNLLINNSELLKIIGESANSTAAKHYSKEVVMKKWDDFYNRLLNK